MKGGLEMFLFFNTPKYDFNGTHTAVDVAAYIVYTCAKERHPISNLQLQKILYFIQTYFLQNEHKALFSDDIEAWPFGPVVRDVYYKYCGFGSLDIYPTVLPQGNFTTKEKQIIDRITAEKRALQPWTLVEETHAKGKAWDIIYQNGEGYKATIPKDVIVTNG